MSASVACTLHGRSGLWNMLQTWSFKGVFEARRWAALAFGCQSCFLKKSGYKGITQVRRSLGTECKQSQQVIEPSDWFGLATYSAPATPALLGALLMLLLISHSITNSTGYCVSLIERPCTGTQAGT